MEFPLCPLSSIKIQYSKWELSDLIETPLLMACDKGNFESVKRILEKWQSNVNATGVYYLQYTTSNRKILDASPLFVAAYRRHYDIVRHLVKKGADIFAKTSDLNIPFFRGLTPLCGSFASSDTTISTRQQVNDIVRFLLESDGSNPSALVKASSRPRVPIWTMPGCGPEATITLIKYGMSLDKFTWCFQTILEYWASKSLCFNGGSQEGSLLELVQLLVEKGVQHFYGCTPLFLSAAPGEHIRSLNFSVFDFLLEREEPDRLDKINALELAGAVILSFSTDPTQIPLAFAYWRRAHHLRYLVGSEPIPKTPIIFKKVPQRVEWTTLPQLQEIEKDPSQHKIASLLVYLRIFSAAPYNFLFDQSYLPQRPVDLVMYPYKQGLQQNTEAVDSLLIALEFITIHKPLYFRRYLRQDTIKIILIMEKLVVSLLEKNPLLCTPELLKASAELITTVNLMMLPSLIEVSDNEMCKYSKIILRFVNILADHPDKMTNCILDALTQLVRHHDGHTKGGFNLLLLACRLLKNDGPVADLFLLIILPVIRLLLRAQANPNVVNQRLRGPLHFLAYLNYADQERIDHLGNLLVENGAHPYMVDEEGRTAADIWLLVRNQGPQQENHRVLNRNDLPDWCLEGVPKLKCLTAKIVRRFRIPYVNQIPATLDPFIEKH